MHSVNKTETHTIPLHDDLYVPMTCSTIVANIGGSIILHKWSSKSMRVGLVCLGFSPVSGKAIGVGLVLLVSWNWKFANFLNANYFLYIDKTTESKQYLKWFRNSITSAVYVPPDTVNMLKKMNWSIYPIIHKSCMIFENKTHGKNT